MTRIAAGVAGAALVAGVTPGASWAAGPAGRLGPVEGLAVTAVAAPSAYRLTADWGDLDGARRYDVRLTDAAGTRLAQASVTDSDWSGSTVLGAGQTVRVTVLPWAGIRRGKQATASAVLPDVTAPSASYSVLRNPANPTDGNVTLRQETLTDDVSEPAAITRTVRWDHGGPEETWPAAQQEVSHGYPGDKALHEVTVTVTDEAGNRRAVTLVIAVSDTQAPTGAFTASTGSAFARWTRVTLEQAFAEDDLSAESRLARTVDWGDGTARESWAHGAAAAHVYAAGGTFQPTVTLVDEAGNASEPIATSPVTVAVDRTAPLTRLRVPSRARTRIASWTTLRGTAHDRDGVGVRFVRVKLVQQRRTAWFAYQPGDRTWARSATKASALRRAGVAKVTTTSTGHWTLRVGRLAKGVLLVRASGLDRGGNESAWLSHQKRLTRR